MPSTTSKVRAHAWTAGTETAPSTRAAQNGGEPVAATDIAATPRMIRLRGVLERVSVSRSTLQRLIEAGDFPRGIALSPRTRTWVTADVDAWLADRIAAAKRVSR